MKISENGLNLIKNFEGCRLTAYKALSTEEYYTIGWGHYGSDVLSGETISQTQADEILKSDLNKYENYVNNTEYCPVISELNQNQFDALVSFCYNCGAGSLETLCKNRNVSEIGSVLALYVKSGDKTIQGLVNRRNAEIKLYNMGVEEMTKEEIETIVSNKITEILQGNNTDCSEWAKTEFDKAITAGITDGTRPLGYATRQECAIMVSRAINK